MNTMLLLALAGVLAGGITTIASLGGGILLIALLGQFWSPAVVLAVTAPALFVGNASRMAMMARQVDWKIVGRFAFAGVPTALAASLVASQMPSHALKAVLGAFLLVFVAHELRPKAESSCKPAKPWDSAAAGALAGTVSGLTGGGGFVASPLLARQSLQPAALVATSAACMALLHLTKGAGFGMSQVFTPQLILPAFVLATGVVVGNAVGARVITRLSKKTFRRCLLAVVSVTALQLLWAAYQA